MDSSSQSIGPSPGPPAEAAARPAGRSRTAAKIERVIAATLAGDRTTVLNASSKELLSEALPVAGTIRRALARSDGNLPASLLLHDLLRRSAVADGLIDALESADAPTRAGAARICGAARMSDAVLWLGDLLQDPSPAVREAAVRGLAELGGRRAIDLLVAAGPSVPLHRLAIGLAKAASDIDIEALMRQPVSEHAAVATVMASGLKRDALRIPPLLGIAHDRRWPVMVRQAACKSLAMIGNRSAADGLARLAEADPDPAMRKLAGRAHRRLLRRAVARRR